MLHLILSFYLFLNARGTTDCSESGGCANQIVDDTTSISCSGYEACDYCQLDAPTIECGGQRGCEDSLLVSAEQYRCYGAYSCDGNLAESGAIDEAYTGAGFICSGVRSCSDSTLYAPYIEAQGYYSLWNSAIYAETSTAGTTYFYIYAGWGAKLAAFHSNSVSNVAVYFYGVGSADSAAFYCLGGSSCYIYCAAYACDDAYVSNDLIIYSDSDSTVTLVCDVTGSGCATETTLSTLEAKEFLKTKTTKPAKIEVTKHSNKLINKQIHGQLVSKSEENNEKKLINKKQRKLLGWTYCQESEACCESTYSAFDSISCRGADSCTGSTFEDWTGWMSAYGFYGAKSSVISNGPDAQCHGYFSCKGATITDTTRLWVSGFGGANEATITNVNQIVSSTGYALESATITASTEDLYIYSWGQNLQDATINVDGRTAYIRFYGYSSGVRARVNCRNGATCYVYCGYYACSNAVVWTSLDSTTTVSCISSSSDYCPTEEEEESLQPTNEPTLSPVDEVRNYTNEVQATGTINADIINCDGQFACHSAILVASDTITCDGAHHTCSYSQLTAGNEVNCYGTTGGTCERSTITSETVNCVGNWVCSQNVWATTLNCDGQSACGGLTTDAETINCEGNVACAYLQWQPDTSGSELNCLSSQQCFQLGNLRPDDNIGTVTVTFEDSNYAGASAKFYSGDSNTLYLYEGDGTNPLNGAELFCETGSTCYYECGTSSCAGFNAYCDGDLHDGETFDGTCSEITSIANAKKLGKKVDMSKLVNGKVIINTGGIKNGPVSHINYLYLAIGAVFAVLFLGTFCYWNKDKISSRWNYERIPDEINV